MESDQELAKEVFPESPVDIGLPAPAEVTHSVNIGLPAPAEVAHSIDIELMEKRPALTDEVQMADSINCMVVDSDCLIGNTVTQPSNHPTPPEKPLSTQERKHLYDEIDNLRKERDEALKRVATLEKLLQQRSMSSDSVRDNDDKCQMMTGIKWVVFLKLFSFLSNFIKPNSTTKDSLALQEQLFLTLVRLRHNLSFDFLAFVVGIPRSTAIDYFWKWIDVLHDRAGFLVKWQDRENIFGIIPPLFKEKFPRLTCIIDCFEIFVESPKNLLARAQCYSSYKKHCTVKFFIACNPHGMVTFLSKAWGGRASDVQIVRDSGFIDSNYHMPYDQILADRGFTLHEEFATKCGAELLTPSFTKGKKQLSAREVEISRKISSVRIHVERVIGLVKNRYTILKGTMPVRSVQSITDESLNITLSSCDRIVNVCAALTNMNDGIVT